MTRGMTTGSCLTTSSVRLAVAAVPAVPAVAAVVVAVAAVVRLAIVAVVLAAGVSDVVLIFFTLRCRSITKTEDDRVCDEEGEPALFIYV